MQYLAGHFQNKAPPSDTLVQVWGEMQKTPYFMDLCGREGLSPVQKSAAQNGVFFPVWIKEKCADLVLARSPQIAGKIQWKALPPAHQVILIFLGL